MSIPFYRVEVGGDEREKIDEVFDGEAPNIIADLESAFESYIGASYALATSDGTAALHLAMLAIDLKRGDKVLCSINAYPSVPEVVRHFDAEPIFIDINPDTFTIDLDKLEAYLSENKSKKLKAVIVSHVAGQSVELDRLYGIAKLYDVKIIEDASDALGATYNSQKIGATGADITCFDFSPHLRRNVCNGGMLVCDDEEIMERAKLLRNHAMVIDDESLGYIYDVTDIGSQYMMSPLDAATILVQLEKQDENIERQRAIAEMFNERLSEAPHIKLPVANEEHAYSLYIIKVDKNRDSFARELVARGIECGLHYIPLHLLSYYKAKYSLRVNDFPIALRNFQQVLSIPNYAALSDDEVEEICDAILDVAATRV
ncbi:MAG: DegT/DnrJ/EryC1/StrS family aminotransferase [Sulfuricurvum sp.]|uniref:DegT/DnrJ/EryC1/StrS family aminotransferase n=1 Tax=Sulfuricurvum sp. TaxID=2025608 RepID=UPI0026151E91|nr:DegT/DnrJ/EryC1/StrS family aminotransferase [Sulfuricurvum sp.]MDD2369120.1 DegT/DnrJ/EryC1/StrS family aminotransferase [Sulfuricurvum sp.]MDD2949457.1 DegT/DnrJ/EryC1/StrS family aminotransferase [Sulfuricurvum sp.]MDD5118072.1 DegT/DnrJ/EryC1/StrS family aminotransferase [Sulfuricurvum sp.]